MLAKISLLKGILVKNEQKIVLVVGFCLISAISFGFGAFWGQKTAAKPLIIEKQTNEGLCPQNTSNGDSEASNGTQQGVSQASQQAQNISQAAAPGKCAFVGSKNSNKFYVPTCAYAKRVKPENLVCYTSEEEALKKGKIKSDCK